MSVAFTASFVLTVAAGLAQTIFPPTTAGDGGLGIKAQVDGPLSITVDDGGDIYFFQSAEVYKGFVLLGTVRGAFRRIDAVSHRITTVALECNPWSAPADHCLAYAHKLRMRDTKLYVSGHDQVISFDVRTRKSSVIAGTGKLGPYPATTKLAVDAPISAMSFALNAKGDVFIADGGYIRHVDGSSGEISTIAGRGGRGRLDGDGGPATLANLGRIIDVAIDAQNNLFLVSSLSGRIRRIDAATGIIDTIAGHTDGDDRIDYARFEGEGGPAREALLKGPRSLAVDRAGNVYFEVFARICRIDSTTGILRTIAGNGVPGYSGDGGPATEAMIDPAEFALDRDGNLFISDTGNNRIRRVDSKSGTITTIAGNGFPKRPPSPKY